MKKMKTIQEQSKEVIIKVLENQLVHWNYVANDGGILQEVAPLKINLYELLLRNVKNNIFDEETIDYISRTFRDLKRKNKGNKEYEEALKELNHYKQ